MNRVTVNGVTYESEGSVSVSINGGKVSVGGKVITSFDEKAYRLEVSGDLVSLTTDCSVTVDGNILGAAHAGGSISCENIGGSVNAGGSISCGKIG